MGLDARAGDQPGLPQQGALGLSGRTRGIDQQTRRCGISAVLQGTHRGDRSAVGTHGRQFVERDRRAAGSLEGGNLGRISAPMNCALDHHQPGLCVADDVLHLANGVARIEPEPGHPERDRREQGDPGITARRRQHRNAVPCAQPALRQHRCHALDFVGQLGPGQPSSIEIDHGLRFGCDPGEMAQIVDQARQIRDRGKRDRLPRGDRGNGMVLGHHQPFKGSGEQASRQPAPRPDLRAIQRWSPSSAEPCPHAACRPPSTRSARASGGRLWPGSRSAPGRSRS